MQTFGANQNNDLYLGSDGNLVMLSGVDAVQQDAITAMSTLLGEMRYAQDKGMPYQTTVWNQYNPGAFEAAARATLLAVGMSASTTPIVTEVVSFSQSVVAGVLFYTAQIRTIYSDDLVTIANG